MNLINFPNLLPISYTAKRSRSSYINYNTYNLILFLLGIKFKFLKVLQI